MEIYQTQDQWEHFKTTHHNMLYDQNILIDDWVDIDYLKREITHRNTIYLVPEHIRKQKTRLHMLVIWIEKSELDNILKWSLSLYPMTSWIMIFQKKISQSNPALFELELEKEILLGDLKLE